MLSGLSKEELLELLFYYDMYVQHANNTNAYEEGWYPVCIAEFYDNDLEVWKELE